MKRLLAYLFIVLGLGLVFSFNANAEEKLYLKCVHKNLKLLEKSFYSNSGVGIYPKKLPSNFVKVILKVDKDLIRFVKKEIEISGNGYLDPFRRQVALRSALDRSGAFGVMRFLKLLMRK